MLLVATAGAQDSASLDPARLFALLDAPHPAGRDDTADRDAAADALLRLCRKPDVARQTGVYLAATDTTAESRVRVLAAIGRTWDPPGRLYGPVLTLASDADPATAAAAMQALGAYRTREAIQELIHILSEPLVPEPNRKAALAALVQATGRDDLGSNPVAWSAWYDAHRQEGPGQWQDLLAQGVWRRAMRLADERPGIAERATDAYRRLYLALPPAEGRPKVITQLLAASQPELRDLAFELVNRELSAGNPVDPSITDATAALLDSAQPSVRAKAAALLIQLAPVDAGPKLTHALANEADPSPAQEMLRGVARWPSAGAREPLLRWIQNDDPIPGAQTAALAMIQAGLLTSPDDLAQVLIASRRAASKAPTQANCRMLVLLGEPSDVDTVVGLLGSPDATIRAAAAQALSDRPRAVDALLTAAAADPALYPHAVAAVVSCRPTAEGYLRIESLTAPSDAARTEGLLRIASAMSASDLLAVASRPGLDPGFGCAMLSRLTEHGPRPDPRVEDPRAIFAGIMLLSQFRLSLGRPDLALDALDALPPSPPGEDPAAPLRRRTIALLWTNRLAEAAALAAPAAAWLDGLEVAIAEPHARSIVRQIRARFGPTLTLEENRRLEHLSSRLTPEPDVATPTEGADAAPGHR